MGDVDSCSYTDIAMAFLLQSMIPAAERALSTNMEWFRIYREDGLGITFDDPTIVPNIQQFFNRFNNDFQWNIPDCSICHSPEVACPLLFYCRPNEIKNPISRDKKSYLTR